MKNFVRAFLILGLMIVTLVIGQNCSVQQPGVDSIDLMSVGVRHTGFETTCLPCHENRRPGNMEALPTFVNVAINQSAGRFKHDDMFGGLGDCVNCHGANPINVGKTWVGAAFGHTTTAGATVSSCLSCHSVPTATPATNPSISKDHSTIGSQDCATCHTKPGITWADATGGHAHSAITDSGKCYQCHVSQMPTANVFKTNIPAENKNWFTHSALYTGTMGQAGQDCSRCHLATPANLGSSWAGAKYDHKNLSGTNITSCTTCHAKGVDRPAGLVGTPPRFDHAIAGTGDCVSCHSLATRNTLDPWGDGQFNHSPTPTTCISCHASNRPSPSTLVPTLPLSVGIEKSLTKFLHKDSYAGLGDCVSCHSSTPALIGKTWSNSGYYDHRTQTGTKVATCTECHQKPSATPTSNPAIGFDHASIGTQDCASCHTSPGVTWKDATGAHAHSITADRGKCFQCHTSDMPAAGVLKTIYSNKNYFAHSSTYTGTIGVTGDCGDCHLAVPANLGNSWTGGFFDHMNASGSGVSTCVTCHSTGVDRPVGATGTTLNGPLGPYQYNHTNGGTGDCVSCHKTSTAETATPWRDGSYSHSPLPTSCTTCHKQKPADATRYPASVTTVMNVYFHAAGYNGNSDCATCHRNVPANAGVSWAGGLYNHTNATGGSVGTCFACHQNSLPSATTAYPSDLKNSFVHASNYIGSDCKGCHSSKNTDTKLTNAWKTGKWSSSPWGDHKTTSGTKVTTCLPCHSNRDHNKGKECFSCHKNAGDNWDD